MLLDSAPYTPFERESMPLLVTWRASIFTFVLFLLASTIFFILNLFVGYSD